MGTMLSPGVQVVETDMSISPTAVSTSTGAFAGIFTKGQIGKPILVTNEDDLVLYFGEPTDANASDWFVAKSFLNYANTLYISRAYDEASFANAKGEVLSSGVQGVDSYVPQILNPDDFVHKMSAVSFSGTNAKIKFIARDSGLYGNSLKIVVASPSSFVSGTVQGIQGVYVNNMFASVPTTGQLAIAVTDGTNILETFIVSTIKGVKDAYNKSIYIEDLINSKSQYVYAVVNSGDAETTIIDCVYGNGTDSTLLSLSGGAEDTVSGDQIGSAYDVFSNVEEIDIDLVIANESAQVAAAQLAISRADCICFIGQVYDEVAGQPAGTVTTNAITAVTTGSLNAVRSNFAAYFANYCVMYDKYADKDRWVNVAGHMAGLRAQTSTNQGAYQASAGLIYGQMKGIKKLAVVFNQGQRDMLYKSSVNIVTSFPGAGNVCYGNKNLQSYASAMDRIHTRAVFNRLERIIGRMAKAYVFAVNDQYTRNRFKATISPVLAGDKGVSEFYVDLSKNDPATVAAGEFKCNILLKPTSSMEFVQLNFVAVGASVDFREVIGAL